MAKRVVHNGDSNGTGAPVTNSPHNEPIPNLPSIATSESATTDAKFPASPSNTGTLAAVTCNSGHNRFKLTITAACLTALATLIVFVTVKLTT
jgi:hypothetical protein